MIKIIIIITFFFASFILSAQNTDVYWDKERTTTHKTILGAAAKSCIKANELPIGITEIV
ncbi:hypothetical protein [Flavobacterium sp. UBA6046]|jgi:hypothetical protein|uniref:hypothetical protein n=1 Tax=Flavobacterium sp. UBA6046 TaxID=1946552 RepID=UPI0025BDBCDF|nr:hypothetical protein [Flavobacterium sp. UBA6046]